MKNKFKKAMEAYNLQQFFGGKIKQDKQIGEAFAEGLKEGMGDPRYNKPKQEPKASDELVDQTIEETEIYNRAKELILKAQRKQVAYGLDKYPTPLSADVWDILETIDHILDESIDKTHYLVMLRIHLERIAERQREDFKQVYSDHLDAMTYSFAAMQKHMPDHGGCNLGDLSMAGADMDGDTVTYCENDVKATEEFYRAVEEEEKSTNITININVNGTVDPNKLAKDITELIQKEGRIRGN